MNLDKELVEHIAKSAKLHLSEEEKTNFLKDFKDILEVFEKIKEADTENIKPSFHPIPLKNAMREDVPNGCLSQEQALSLTKQKKGEFFLGPKAL